MKQTYKKRLALIVTGLAISLIALVILIKTFLPPKLYTELIINAQNSVDLTDISIYGSDFTYKQIHAFTFSGQDLKATSQDFVPYSEGFIEQNQFKNYQKIFSQNGQPLTSTFQDYYETDTFTFFAFPGDLSTFRILENATGKLSSLNLPQKLYTHSMYVSDMRVIDNQLIILAGEAMSYHALIYTVDLNTFDVIDYKRLETHPSALNSMHYTLTDDGLALFIAGNTLQIYNPLDDTLSYFPLPFEAEGVLCNTQYTFTYALQENEVKYLLLENKELLYQKSVPTPYLLSLPSSWPKVLDLTLKDNLVYLLLEDLSGPRFKNYLSVYNLDTQEMSFCLGISDSNPLILTGFQN